MEISESVYGPARILECVERGRSILNYFSNKGLTFSNIFRKIRISFCGYHILRYIIPSLEKSGINSAFHSLRVSYNGYYPSFPNS